MSAVSGEIDGTMQDWPDLTEDEIWNAALDAAAEACDGVASDWEDGSQAETCATRVRALKKGGTQ